MQETHVLSKCLEARFLHVFRTDADIQRLLVGVIDPADPGFSRRLRLAILLEIVDDAIAEGVVFQYPATDKIWLRRSAQFVTSQPFIPEAETADS